MSDTDDKFDQILKKVGDNGRFQKIFIWIYIIALTFCLAMITFNIILALNGPDHWCHVPGMDRTNLTIEEWKDRTLPREPNNRGEMTFSSCKMYKRNFSQIQSWEYESNNIGTSETSGCAYGYEYDREWYDRSIATDQDWVCDKDLYVTNIFVISRVSEVVGTFFTGQLSDILGRKKILLISIIVILFGRSLSLLVTSSFWLFITLSGFAVLTSNSMQFAPLIVGLELSKEEQRSMMAMAQGISWGVGTIFMSLTYWLFRDWVPYMWITTLPSVIFLILFPKYMIESPRWLISKQRFGEAVAQFEKIGKINGKKIDLCEKDIVDLYSNVKSEKTYGIMSLFSNWELAKTTLIIAFCWCVNNAAGFSLVLSSIQIGGNPFMNFILLSIVGVPSCLLARYLADTLGRRLTNATAFGMAGLACIPMMILVKNSKYPTALAVLTAIISFISGISGYIVNLQTLEVFPTCLRQTGLSVGTIVGNSCGALAPYFVYLGTNYDVRYPYYILIVIFFLGGFSSLFLPETLHQKLPDTIYEAQEFNKRQKFWSLPKSVSKDAKLDQNSKDTNMDEDQL